MRRATLLLGFLLPVLVSCASDQKLAVTGFWVPALQSRMNRDHRSHHHHYSDNSPFRADLRTGSGAGARVALEEGNAGLGALFFATDQRERQTGAETHIFAADLEYVVAAGRKADPPAVYGAMGFGVGGMVFDFDRQFHDTGGPAVFLRIEGGLAVTRSIRIQAGGGFYFWGYPGVTLGDGGFLTLGATIRF